MKLSSAPHEIDASKSRQTAATTNAALDVLARLLARQAAQEILADPINTSKEKDYGFQE